MLRCGLPFVGKVGGGFVPNIVLKLGYEFASGMNTEKNGNTRVLNREVLIANFNLREQKPCIGEEKSQAVLTLDAAQ